MKYTLDDIPQLDEALQYEAKQAELNTKYTLNLSNIKQIEGFKLEDSQGKHYLDFTSNFFNTPLGFKSYTDSGNLYQNFVTFDLDVLLTAAENFLGTQGYKLVIDSDFYQVQKFIFQTLQIHHGNKLEMSSTINVSDSHIIRHNDFTHFKSKVHHEIDYLYFDPISPKGECLSEEFRSYIKDLRTKKRLHTIVELGQYDLSRYPKHLYATHDILILRKGIGNGIPLTIALLKEELCSHLLEQSVTIVDTLSQAALQNAVEQLNYLAQTDFKNLRHSMSTRLKDIYDNYLNVVNAWGYNNLAFIEFEFPVGILVQECLQRGIVVNHHDHHDILLAPSLYTTENDVKILFDTLEQALQAIDPDCKVPLESNFPTNL